jgi:hypothetical protein
MDLKAILTAVLSAAMATVPSCTLFSAAVGLTGCALENKSPVAQPAQQKVEQAQLNPARIYIMPSNGPGEKNVPDIAQDESGAVEILDALTGHRMATSQPAASPGGAGLASTSAGFVQLNYVNITVAGTTTGAQTGTPSAAPSNTTNQTQRPETQVNPALAFGMPGSAPNANSTSTGFEGGGSASSSNAPTQNATWNNLIQKAAAGDPAAIKFLDFAAQLFGVKTTTTQPVTP